MEKLGKILAIGIPLLILAYIFFQNFLISHDYNYFYDIGSENDNYLSPNSRISDKIIEDDSNYRNLTEGLVYFEVPILKGSNYININARFKDNFPEYGRLRIGASDQEVWHYKYNLIFDESLFPNTNGQWLIGETVYNIKQDNLTIQNGKLSLLFNIPHLSPDANTTNTQYIPIDWINITVHKDGWIW